LIRPEIGLSWSPRCDKPEMNMAEAVGWRDWLGRLQAEGKLPTGGQTLDGMRLALRRGLEVFEEAPPELAEMRLLQYPGPAGPMEARLYVPLAGGLPPAGALVYYHGGGFVMCDLDTHDRLCRRLAAASHMRILAIEYRLAPANKFPAAYDDALAAFDWAKGPGAMLLGLDPARIGVGGDSAGGNLAAAVAQARRKSPGASSPSSSHGGAAFQLLIYPLLQFAENNVHRQRILEGYTISTAILDSVRQNYLSTDDDPNDVRASPLFERNLSGVAPAFIVTAGLDPLQHEGKAYADMLAAAGVAAKVVHYPGAPHGFLQMTAVLDIAHEAIEACGEAVGKALAG
jgi:acetyl esterase